MKQWTIIPMQEHSHLSVVREEDGNIVATVQNQYAKAIGSVPELVRTCREIFEELKRTNPHWDPGSLMGRLEAVIKD